MQIIRLNDYRKEGAAVARPSPSVQSPVIDKTERHRRHRIWREAQDVADYYLALQRFAREAKHASRLKCAPAQHAAAILAQLDYCEAETVAFRRIAIADLIRTPAPTQQQIWWKKRQFKDGFLFEFISPKEARACIAADEAFHRANPTRKASKSKGGGQ